MLDDEEARVLVRCAQGLLTFLADDKAHGVAAKMWSVLLELREVVEIWKALCDGDAAILTKDQG